VECHYEVSANAMIWEATKREFENETTWNKPNTMSGSEPGRALEGENGKKIQESEEHPEPKREKKNQETRLRSPTVKCLPLLVIWKGKKLGHQTRRQMKKKRSKKLEDRGKSIETVPPTREAAAKEPWVS